MPFRKLFPHFTLTGALLVCPLESFIIAYGKWLLVWYWLRITCTLSVYFQVSSIYMITFYSRPNNTEVFERRIRSHFYVASRFDNRCMWSMWQARLIRSFKLTLNRSHIARFESQFPGTNPLAPKIVQWRNHVQHVKEWLSISASNVKFCLCLVCTANAEIRNSEGWQLHCISVVFEEMLMFLFNLLKT